MINPTSLVSALLESDEELSAHSYRSDDALDIEDVMSMVGDAPGVPVDLYQKFDRMLGDRTRLKIKNNTYVVRLGDGSIGLLLYATHILVVSPENRVVVNTGGWETRTTLQRIGMYSPGGWAIYTLKGCSYWGNSATHVGYHPDKRRFPFTDGDVIEPDGALKHQAPPQLKK